MHAHLDLPTDIRTAFLDAGVTPSDSGAPTVTAAPRGNDWSATLDGLTGVFRASKAAAAAGRPIVYLVSADALLGRTGALDAMAAAGVVSAARTLAMEVRKQGTTANCLAYSTDTPLGEVVRWALHLLASGASGPNGELIQLGGVQIGKALS